ncbi:MAG: putative phosphoesterase [Nonlabens sp.]|jgi:putative phosphoesterase
MSSVVTKVLARASVTSIGAIYSQTHSSPTQKITAPSSQTLRLTNYLCTMKILLLSDTHSHLDDFIIKYVNQADEVWHAGDIGDLKVTDQIAALKPLRAVYGNIDNDQARMQFPLNNRFNCEGMDVWITHIGGYPGRYNQRVRSEIYSNPPDIFICGHSHILKVINDKKINCLHMNPGAIGMHGFHKKRTMLRFEINDGKISNLEVVEKDR